jgi:hypothetical protein
MNANNDSHPIVYWKFALRMHVACVCLLLSGSVMPAQNQTPPTVVPTQFTYRGFIHSAPGPDIPILFRIFRNPSTKSGWAGAFIIGIEAGPYSLSKVTHDPIMQTWSFESKGSYRAPDWGLRGELKEGPDHKLSGKVETWNAWEGVMDLTLDQGADFNAKPLLAGRWVGACIGNDPKLHGVILQMDSEPPPHRDYTQNMDLPWAPVKSGSLLFANAEPSPAIPALVIVDTTSSSVSCVIDYLRTNIGCNMKPYGSRSQAVVATFEANFSYSDADHSLHNFKLTDLRGETMARVGTIAKATCDVLSLQK